MARHFYREDGVICEFIEGGTQKQQAAYAIAGDFPCFMRPPRMALVDGQPFCNDLYGALVVANGEAWTLDLTEVPGAVLDAFRREMEQEQKK